jgi:hypothetical protein
MMIVIATLHAPLLETEPRLNGMVCYKISSKMGFC